MPRITDVTALPAILCFDIYTCPRCEGRFPWYELCLVHSREADVATTRTAGSWDFPGGWVLSAEEHSPYWYPRPAGGYHIPPRVTTWRLECLALTSAELARLSAGRADSRSWQVTEHAGTAVIPFLAVSEDEARAIRRGEHPLNVLMPRIWARPLTLGELMAA